MFVVVYDKDYETIPMAWFKDLYRAEAYLKEIGFLGKFYIQKVILDDLR